METILQYIIDAVVSLGIPATVGSLLGWHYKRKFEKRDAKAAEEAKLERAARDEREKNIETMILLITQTGRATNILAEATARAVQRIPDAQCNGDMAAALEKVEEIQRKEQQFLIDHGVKHIFGD